MGKLAGTLVVSSERQHWVSEHWKRGHFFTIPKAGGKEEEAFYLDGYSYLVTRVLRWKKRMNLVVLKCNSTKRVFWLLYTKLILVLPVQ